MKIIRKIYKNALKNNGCSYSLVENKSMSGQKFYSVAITEKLERVIIRDNFTEDELQNYITKNLSSLKIDDSVLGIWFKDDKIYLDVGKLIKKSNKQKALELGRESNQRAIYDLEKNEEILI